ncbi:MAG: exosortase/archaeosortase family protein [Phycisphaerae bacterium]
MTQAIQAESSTPIMSSATSLHHSHWRRSDLLVGLAALGMAIWCYWGTLLLLWREWSNDPNYSVGRLIPLMVLYVLVQERSTFARLRPRTNWLGLVVVVAALFLRYEMMRSLYESLERYSFILLLAGIVLLLCGFQILWKAKWMLVFLALMIPLPGRVHNAIAGPMQDWATGGTVFLLEIFGIAVERNGSVLQLNGVQDVNVAEACSGLRMLTAFVAVAALFAFLVSRPVWQRALLVISSIPIAIICNLIRLAITAFLFLKFETSLAESFFHDFAGWTMMPMAIGFLFLELWIVDQIFRDPKNPHSTSGSPSNKHT